MALLNDVGMDTKILAVKKKKSMAAVAREIGTPSQYLNRVVNGHVTIVNELFIRALENLGYDVKIEYLPMKSEENEIVGE